MIWIPIDRSSATPLIRQVYDQIRIQILRGHLKGGERLPSTRELASHLHVSRNVILEAYEQLLAEGFIESRQGAGTFITEGVYLEQLTSPRSSSNVAEKLEGREKINDIIDFRSGLPALNLFPQKIWGQLAKEVCVQTPPTAFGYGKPEGRLELRYTLSQYLRQTRGVQCDPDQLIITTGATQALSLIAKLLLSNGNEVMIEDPITYEIHTIFSPPGTTLCPIPVDQLGMKTHLLPESKRPSFVYVTPSHQFPLGGILPIQRRVQLIQYARITGCYIVEDDYDSEFRYEGPPINSLQGLDPDRVIYIGTFSKILSPALRMGYLILPHSLTERCRNLKWFTDLHTPPLEQLTLARFIEQGYLERHIAKMKKIYRKRRDFLIDSLTRYFPNKVNIMGQSTGLHLVAEFLDVEFTPQMLEKIEQNGTRIYPVEIHAICKGSHRNRIILGYGNLPEEKIEEGIQRLQSVLS